MTRRRIVLGGALLVAIAGLVALGEPSLRALVEPPDPAVVTVSDEATLRDAFNAHADCTRVVAWLSPT
jgi:hypothetical protein